ncbi:MAG TPA: peptidylprolyl isomerase [Burkholderiales bacterium]|nr:peptidylprolyl isomerase [Burkholderiales bacterium]
MNISDWLFPIFALAAAATSGGAAAADPQVELKTNMGTIRLELYPEKAPLSVENFLKYVQDGHYDGTIFHRVIPNFMIQGGGFDKGMQQKKTRDPIRNEAEQALNAGLRNEIGTIAMARTSNPHSATAQFFINVNDNTFLNAGVRDAGYAVFGKVVSGLDIVGNIAKMPTGPGDVPREMVIIEKATVVPPKK